MVRSLRHISRLWPFGYKRVLVLEDDTMMQKLVVKLLRPLPVKVDIFGNGRDVVRTIDAGRERYDSFLVDLMMPHDGGLTVLRHLRQQHPSLLRRVILMSASSHTVIDPWAPLIFAVVHKPFDGSALVTAVTACLQQPESLVA